MPGYKVVARMGGKLYEAEWKESNGDLTLVDEWLTDAECKADGNFFIYGKNTTEDKLSRVSHWIYHQSLSRMGLDLAWKWTPTVAGKDFGDEIVLTDLDKYIRPYPCYGCANYHGRDYNGTQLVCAMHPYGWNDRDCPDHEAWTPKKED